MAATNTTDVETTDVEDQKMHFKKFMIFIIWPHLRFILILIMDCSW